jgi:hypothetical protein
MVPSNVEQQCHPTAFGEPHESRPDRPDLLDAGWSNRPRRACCFLDDVRQIIDRDELRGGDRESERRQIHPIRVSHQAGGEDPSYPTIGNCSRQLPGGRLQVGRSQEPRRPAGDLAECRRSLFVHRTQERVSERADRGSQPVGLERAWWQAWLPFAQSSQELDPPPIGILSGESSVIVDDGSHSTGLHRDVGSDARPPEPQAHRSVVSATLERDGSHWRHSDH